MSISVEHIAKILLKAERTNSPVNQSASKFSVDEAYAIQQCVTNYKIDNGEECCGFKLGFTGETKRKKMGVDDVIWGRIFKSTQVGNGFGIDLNKWIRPKCEPEIAFLIKKDITTEISIEQVSDYVDGIATALEIADSRYLNFTFSLPDVIADNSFAGGFVIGDWMLPSTDISSCNVDFLVNDRVKSSGLSSNILNNPFRAITELSRLLSKRNISIHSGDIILAGAITNAEILKPGMNVAARVENLGDVEFFTKKYGNGIS